MEEPGEIDEKSSLALTPTWAVSTVVVLLVSCGFLFHASLKQLAQWLHKTKRKALRSALDKIKDELMLFGLLSLLMGHWIVFVAKICVKSSYFNRRFFPCAVNNSNLTTAENFLFPTSKYANNSASREPLHTLKQENDYCPEGQESFASKESLEQLHRLLFVLGITHVSYSFVAIALAMIKLYSWRKWEYQAKTMVVQNVLGSTEAASDDNRKFGRLRTFIVHNTSHPWTYHRVLVWLLCFSRQFWSSINHSDYMALRMGFIAKHQLPLTYDFHHYMLRNMEEEFSDIVGISVPLWIYAICCIFLQFHGTDLYFWLSFLPAAVVLLIGTKLHRVVVKLAVEIRDTSTSRPANYLQFNLRDELFWFGKPRLLLWSIQFISFQNAFEMATFLWSLWEIKDSSCFMENGAYIGIRLTFGVASQIWCSFITFPLYVIITQMGSKFKKTVVSENVRKSLHGWQRRVKARQTTSSSRSSLIASHTSMDSMMLSRHTIDDSPSTSSSIKPSSSAAVVDTSTNLRHQDSSTSQDTSPCEISQDHNEIGEVLHCSGPPPTYDSSSGDDDDDDDDVSDAHDLNHSPDQNDNDKDDVPLRQQI